MSRRATEDARATAPRRAWRERLTLGRLLTWTAAASILIASLVAGFYALTVLYENKLADTWAIMFLELEHEGVVLAGRLASRGAALDASAAAADVVLGVAADGRLESVAGGLGRDLRLSDFNIDAKLLPADLAPLSVLTYQGESYLARYLRAPAAAASAASTPVGSLVLRRIAASAFVLHPARPADQGLLYVLTREGRLLFANDPRLSEIDVVGRPLVQRFVSAPLRQGQLELTSAEGEAMFGFFAEVPKTNVMLFSEVSKAAAMASVRQVVLRFLTVLALILVVAVALLQFPLAGITAPVRELAQLALTVGQGRFDVSPKLKGFGELSVLTSAFTAMAAGLVERDQRVAVLMREQAEKSRLAGELALARRIQENFLPAQPLPKAAGLAVAVEYLSAAECAGDWYQYAYDPDRRETVVVIADVAGHGAGASMFTAIIAGLFEEFRTRPGPTFDIAAFATATNGVIHRLGRQQWHASMMILRFVAGAEHLDLLLAGHPPPLLSLASDAAPTRVFPGSAVLGIEPDFRPLCHRLPFPKGSRLLAYTDGLTEASNAAGKVFGRKRVRESFLNGPGEPRETLARLLGGWRAHLAGGMAADDVCVLVMRAA